MSYSITDLSNRTGAASRPGKKDSGIKINHGKHPCRASMITESCSREHDARTAGTHGSREEQHKVPAYAARQRIQYMFEDGLTISFDLDGIERYYALKQKHEELARQQDVVTSASSSNPPQERLAEIVKASKLPSTAQVNYLFEDGAKLRFDPVGAERYLSYCRQQRQLDGDIKHPAATSSKTYDSESPKAYRCPAAAQMDITVLEQGRRSTEMEMKKQHRSAKHTNDDRSAPDMKQIPRLRRITVRIPKLRDD